jgi:hypothetical protein
MLPRWSADLGPASSNRAKGSGVRNDSAAIGGRADSRKPTVGRTPGIIATRADELGELDPSRTPSSKIIAANSETVGSQSHSLRQYMLLDEHRLLCRLQVIKRFR